MGNDGKKIESCPNWTRDRFREEVAIAWEWCMGTDDYLESWSMSVPYRLQIVKNTKCEWTKYRNLLNACD